MDVDRKPILSHEPCHAPDVIHVRVRENDGLRIRLPGTEEYRYPVRLCARIDDNDVFTRSHEKAVGLEGPHGNCPNLEM